MTTETIEGVVGQVTTIAGYDEGLPNVHRLKCDGDYFADMWNGVKAYELRKDDREYRIGDLLLLCEHDPRGERGMWRHGMVGPYSGRWIMARVVSMIDRDDSRAGALLGTGYAADGVPAVVMGIREIARAEYGTDPGSYGGIR